MTEDKINEIATTLLGYLETVTSFAVTEIPRVLQEVLTWAVTYNLMVFFIINAAAALVCFPLLRYALRRYKARQKKEEGRYPGFEEEEGFPFVIGTAMWVVAFAISMPPLLDAVKALVAPRVYLIEYVSQLL